MRLMEAVVRGVKELGELGAKLGGRQVRGGGLCVGWQERGRGAGGGAGCLGGGVAGVGGGGLWGGWWKTAGRRMRAGAKGR